MFGLGEIRSASTSIPAPVGGWNARDPLDLMAPQDAVKLENIIPNTTSGKLRRGYREHADGMGSNAVETLIEYAGKDGSRKLIAAANSNLYNATTYDTSATSLGSGYTNNRWQSVQIKDKLILVNGDDQPLQYDGSTVSNAAYTGVADDSVFIQVSLYKSRLYFVEKDSTSVWYAGVAAVTGAVTEYDVGDVLKRGGFVQFAGSWTRDTGSGLSDLFVIVSNLGEVLVYEGDNPGASNWALVGRFYLPIPLGRRSFIHYNSDLVIITEDGVYPMSSVINSQGAVPESSLTAKINTAFNAAARLHSSNFGWQGVIYPRGRYAMINIPITEGVQSEQYVMNTQTLAWCKFTCVNASSWCVFNEKPYFGGMDGKIYEFDFGDDDAGSAIPFDVKWAFNYFGDRNQMKRFLMAKPLLLANTDLTFTFDVEVDFQSKAVSSTATLTGPSGAEWDTATWDTAEWADGGALVANWYSIGGLGRAAALRMRGSTKDIDFEINAVHVTYEAGGYL